MQLLVSVRAADEVGPALTGGADIIDAKEPSRGSLGPVSPAVLTEILAAVPTDRAFSVALGDLTRFEDIRAALDVLRIGEYPGPVYLKLGFAGVDSPAKVQLLIEHAIRLARKVSGSLSIVPVAYADAERAKTITPSQLPELAGQAGAAGVLLDTYLKDGNGLFHWFDAPALGAWVADARRRRLLAALAGSLGLADMELVRAIQPDVVGVRGAACEGGREGQISAERVRALRQGFAKRVIPAQNLSGQYS